MAYTECIPAPTYGASFGAPETRAARDRRLGLSITHIVPRHMELQLASGGHLVKLRAMGGPGSQVGGGRRGVVRGLSSASRMRMMQRVASIDRTRVEHLPLMITLTYPAIFPTDGPTIKAHLDAFCKRLWREFGLCGAVWRLEFQERGAPHFHLLVFAPPGATSWYVPYRWVATAWYEVVGSGNLDHLRAGTEVRRIRSWRGVLSYVSEYMTKPGDRESDPLIGRVWGVRHPELLHIVLLDYPVDDAQGYRIRRVLWRILSGRGVIRRPGGQYAGCTVFMDAAQGSRCLRL